MYESFFQLQSRPFAAAPVVETYFPSRSIEHARQTLIRTIERAEGPGLVIGPAGTGKSLLLRLLADYFLDVFHFVHLSSARVTNRKDLLQSILFELDLPYRELDESELRLTLLEFLRPSEYCPHGILLLVDEAHSLSLRLLDEIRMITNFVSEGEPRVRLVLAGDSRLDERFANPKLASFNQRVAARCYLEPMPRDEAIEYVQAQVTAVGGNPSAIFSDDAFIAIYRATDGIPRLINQVCDHALVMARLGGQTRIDGRGIEEAWADLQQLPGPWQPTPSYASANDSVLEFGTLEDDLELATPQTPMGPAAKRTDPASANTPLAGGSPANPTTTAIDNATAQIAPRTDARSSFLELESDHKRTDFTQPEKLSSAFDHDDHGEDEDGVSCVEFSGEPHVEFPANRVAQQPTASLTPTMRPQLPVNVVGNPAPNVDPTAPEAGGAAESTRAETHWGIPKSAGTEPKSTAPLTVSPPTSSASNPTVPSEPATLGVNPARNEQPVALSPRMLTDQAVPNGTDQQAETGGSQGSAPQRRETEQASPAFRFAFSTQREPASGTASADRPALTPISSTNVTELLAGQACCMVQPSEDPRLRTFQHDVFEFGWLPDRHELPRIDCATAKLSPSQLGPNPVTPPIASSLVSPAQPTPRVHPGGPTVQQQPAQPPTAKDPFGEDFQDEEWVMDHYAALESAKRGRPFSMQPHRGERTDATLELPLQQVLLNVPPKQRSVTAPNVPSTGQHERSGATNTLGDMQPLTAREASFVEHVERLHTTPSVEPTKTAPRNARPSPATTFARLADFDTASAAIRGAEQHLGNADTLMCNMEHHDPYRPTSLCDDTDEFELAYSERHEINVDPDTITLRKQAARDHVELLDELRSYTRHWPSLDFATSDDRDMIIVESERTEAETNPVNTNLAPPATSVRRIDYHQLFAQLRKG
jgi:type II secretory pathway predicted ATPase ExeA